MAENSLSDALNDALNQESFDVLEFVTGDLTPRTKVTIYTDADAGYRLNELLAIEESSQRDAQQGDGLSIADDVAWVDPDEVDGLKQRIEASAVTFHLKGLAPKAREALQKELRAKHNVKDDSDEETQNAYYVEFFNTLTAKTIEFAENARGAKDTSWSSDKVATLEGRVNATEMGHLAEKVNEVNFDTDLFSRAVNADFLSKR